MLAHLALAQRSQAPVEFVAVDPAGRVGSRHSRQIRLGAAEQVFALAPPLGGHQRVVAHQQAFVGVVRRTDAGQPVRVAQRGLEVVLADQLADAVVAQGSDPVQLGRLQIARDARLGQHAAVADHGHALQAETAA